MARQARLPGTEDAAIVELEQAADDYMEVRDERLKYLKKEVEEKQKILGILKANGKKSYRRVHHSHQSRDGEVAGQEEVGAEEESSLGNKEEL